MASTLSQQVAQLTAQVAALATLVSAQAAAPVRAARTQSPSEPLSAMRERAAGGTAPCGRTFATANGLAYHVKWHAADQA